VGVGGRKGARVCGRGTCFRGCLSEDGGEGGCRGGEGGRRERRERSKGPPKATRRQRPCRPGPPHSAHAAEAAARRTGAGHGCGGRAAQVLRLEQRPHLGRHLDAVAAGQRQHLVVILGGERWGGGEGQRERASAPYCP
jgi:hypothetical protein